MNYKAHIKAFRDARVGWLEILAKSPDSLVAAQHIASINAKIELLHTLRYGEGDYSEID